MLGTQHLWLFVVSGLMLNVTPGQDTLYIVGRTVAQGQRAGLLSVAGIASGTVVHTLAAAFGLSAILATSAAAFTVVKLAGAGYLVYLGMKLLLQRRPAPAAADGVSFAEGSAVSIYRAGLFTNVLNPKVALFFMAFLPQFVAPDAPSRVLPFLFLGAVFIFNGTLWCLVLVWTASAMSRRLTRSESWGVALKRATGVLFLGLGFRLAVSK